MIAKLNHIIRLTELLPNSKVTLVPTKFSILDLAIKLKNSACQEKIGILTLHLKLVKKVITHLSRTVGH